jgi:hypothetical protein
VDYDLRNHTIGKGDIVAAWVLCIALGAAAIFYPPTSTSLPAPVAEASVMPKQPPVRHTSICSNERLPVLPRRG